MFPRQVAETFVRETFEGSRQLDGETFQGEWKGRTFEGTFQLADGVKVYNIRGNTDGRWIVD